MKESASSPLVRDDSERLDRLQCAVLPQLDDLELGDVHPELGVGEPVVGALDAGQQRLHAVAHRQPARAGADEQARRLSCLTAVSVAEAPPVRLPSAEVSAAWAMARASEAALRPPIGPSPATTAPGGRVHSSGSVKTWHVSIGPGRCRASRRARAARRAARRGRLRRR